MDEKLCRHLVRERAVSYDPSLISWGSALPCEACGTWGGVEMHHRKFRSRGGLWVPSNIVAICKVCHLGATDEAPWVAQSGLNVHTWEDTTEVPVELWHSGLCLLDDEGLYKVLDNA